MEQLLIGESFRDDVRKILRADDMFISGGDIAFAGMAMGGATVPINAFASYIASLSHILTRIVLSERIVFVYSPGQGAEKPPTSHLLPLIEQNCSTVQIDQRCEMVSPVVEDALGSPMDVFDDDLVTNVTECVRRYAPWSDASMAHALLAEYAVANVLGASYAPNPFVSEPFGRDALKGKTTEDEMLRYIEDLRRETSQQMNLLKGVDIYDLRLPAIFGVVLQQSSCPADLVRVASQMNADAKEFRSWCRTLDSMESKHPHKYLGQLRAAQKSLRKLDAPVSVELQKATHTRQFRRLLRRTRNLEDSLAEQKGFEPPRKPRKP